MRNTPICVSASHRSQALETGKDRKRENLPQQYEVAALIPVNRPSRAFVTWWKSGEGGRTTIA
jgi:hypothetical protein